MNLRNERSWLVCVGVLALGIFAYVYGPAIELYYLTKRAVKDDASLMRVPVPVTTSKATQPAGKAFVFFGVEFRVPWGGEAQVKQWQKLARIQFPEGQFVLLFDPSQRVDRIKALTESGQSHVSERVFGRDSMRSNYAMVSAILNVAPKDISLWRPREQLVRNCIFLMLKPTELTNAKTGLFQFQNQRIKGFQKGDPAKSEVVDLDAFDDRDREYQIIVGTTKGTHGLVSQEDINLILSTLEFVQANPQVDRKSEESQP